MQIEQQTENRCGSGTWRHRLETDTHPWRQGLPESWFERVVEPLVFEIQREYEVAAARVIGHDETNTPCYCAYTYALTDLCCEDDDVLYETVIYAEERLAWRLQDGRWLIRHAVSAPEDCGHSRTCLSIADAMPQ